MPRYQGELDGLCGMYAVANAFEFCFDKDAQRSFETCCDALTAGRWPAVLWEGTYFGDIRRMIAACRKEYGLQRQMTVKVPFWKARPRSNNEYWTRFDALMADEVTQCALVRTHKPDEHWLLATAHKSGILFLDSTAGETLSLVKRDTLWAGTRRPRPGLTLLDSRELIIFQKRA